MIQRQAPSRPAMYVRSATVSQDDEWGRIEEQGAACRQLAESLGMEVTAEYRDVGDGTSWDLPGLQAMLDAVRRHDVDLVLCERPDRLARGLAKLSKIETELGRLGVPVHYVAGDGPERRVLTAALASQEAPMRAARDEEA